MATEITEETNYESEGSRLFVPRKSYNTEITSAKNLKILAVEGEQVRVYLHFDESLDVNAFELYGGNTTDENTQLVFTPEIDGNTACLVSNPLPYIAEYIPFQIFVRRIADGSEWVPAMGVLRTTKRLISRD